MNMDIHKQSGILIVSVSGELDHHSAARLRESVDLEIMQGGVLRLIFDFTHLELMDSSGIGVIMGRYKLMQSFGGKVIVAGAASHIQKVICLSGLNKIISLHDSLENAIS